QVGQRGRIRLVTSNRESGRLPAKFRSSRIIRMTELGYKVEPRLMSQFTQVTAPPARIAAPSEVQAPIRAFDAAPWWPFAVAIAQVMAQMMSMSTAMMSTNVSSATITALRSPAPPTPPKSGNTSMVRLRPAGSDDQNDGVVPLIACSYDSGVYASHGGRA